MMIASRDRLWLLGGLVVAVLLTVIAWQFFIKSQSDKTNSVKNEIATAQQQILDSTNQLNQLKADSANLDKYKAALAANQQALPTDTGVPAFLNELHDAGAATGVTVLQLTVGVPTAVTAAPAATTGSAGATAASSGLEQLNLSLVASGTPDNLLAFLKQLQAVQPRAVLVVNVTESPSAGGQSSLSLTFDIFTSGSSSTASAAS
jgi:hypothetical protein